MIRNPPLVKPARLIFASRAILRGLTPLAASNMKPQAPGPAATLNRCFDRPALARTAEVRLFAFSTSRVSSSSSGYSIAFSEASCSGYESPRSMVGTSQRATRDLGDANAAPASIAAGATNASIDFVGSVRGGGSGSLRSSADYKMLIAKADAMLGQFSAQSSGRPS